MKSKALWTLLLVAAGTVAASAETINAAGATFPAPIYQKWFEEFHKPSGLAAESASFRRERWTSARPTCP